MKGYIMIKIRPYLNPNESVFYKDKFYYHQVSNPAEQNAKKVLVAAASNGGYPSGGPGNNNISNFFKKKISKEELVKINESCKYNNILKKNFNSMFNYCKKFIKK